MRRIVFTLSTFLLALPLVAQSAEVADTTSRGYQVGYTIGTYLPVVILLLIIVWFIRRSYRFQENDEQH